MEASELQQTDSPVQPAGGSLEAAVAARRAQLQAQQTVDIPVPSWGGKLVARYRGVSWKETRQSVPTVGAEDIRELTTAANILLIASQDVMFVSDDGSTESLGPWQQAVSKLGVGDITPRQALMAPGGVFQRDTQMMAHFAVLQEWQQGVDEEADELVVGESEAPASGS